MEEKRAKVMGIVNVNRESFYAASRCTDKSLISEKIDSMIAAGADILDIGACSTRPGSTPVTLEQEWEYLKMALAYINEELKREDSPCSHFFRRNQMREALSIDTFRGEIVKRVYESVGEFTVNDISAGEDDTQMLETVGTLHLPYIAMHKRGTPDTMQQLCNYENGVVNEIIEYFKNFKRLADSHNIEEFIVDPGFGFAKTVEQNYQLLSGTGKIKESLEKEFGKSVKILIGLSRKTMIWKPLGITPNEALCGTVALNLQALLLGADIIRVHDVAEGVQCVKLCNLLQKNK